MRKLRGLGSFFRDIKFNVEGTESEYLRKGGIKRLAESIMVNRRNKSRDIKMFLKKLEKGVDTVKKSILTVSKGFLLKRTNGILQP